ncbi:MAG: methyltransferase domain-containing protein [Gammaproteobacteria bacterium]|nr:methyltransferase domain-containing protein [Gammaproteobacteria bacterium]
MTGKGVVLSVQSPIYRTGDIGKWLENGEIEFLGRADNQVKISCQRVDLNVVSNEICRLSCISNCRVVLCSNNSSSSYLSAFIKVHDKYYEEGLKVFDEKNLVKDWQNVFDEYFKYPQKGVKNLCFNTSGWIDSIHHDLIPESHMKEWLDNIVWQILSFKPSNVLEIGCGSGLIFSKIAASIKIYYGIDISNACIEHVRSVAEELGLKSNATFQVGEATEISSDSEVYDMAIMNSVVQYFPSIDYFEEVLTNISKFMAPGGHVFIGDIKNKKTIDALNLEKFKVNNLSMNKKKFIKDYLISIHKELLIDPDYFLSLKGKLDFIEGVSIRCKYGAYSNEMNVFRYDVVLVFKGKPIDYLDKIDYAVIDGGKNNLLEELDFTLSEENKKNRIVVANAICNRRFFLPGQEGYNDAYIPDDFRVLADKYQLCCRHCKV